MKSLVSKVLMIVGTVWMLCQLSSCAILEASNNYVSVELCASWEKAE